MTRRSASSQNLGCYCSYKLRVIFFCFVQFNDYEIIFKLLVFFLFCISILLLFFQTLFLVCLGKKIVYMYFFVTILSDFIFGMSLLKKIAHMYFFVTILSDFIFDFWYVPVKKIYYHICIFVILLLFFHTLFPIFGMSR